MGPTKLSFACNVLQIFFPFRYGHKKHSNKVSNDTLII